jgi:adenosylhomocysteine nucleosidase
VIGIFAAMESEALACPDWTRNGDKVMVPGATVFPGVGAFVCQTGIGREAAQVAAEAVMPEFAPTLVLSVGIAGGLEPGVLVGDVVICTHVDHESHRHADSAQSIYSSQSLLDAALETAAISNLPVRTGTSLTVDEAAWGPAEKAAHHAWKSHDITEMESFWIAAAASKRGLPFIATRSISDASADTLPNIGAMRPDGTLDQEKFLAYLQANPETGPQLSAIAHNSRLALANLAAFLETYLPSLLRLRG